MDVNPRQILKCLEAQIDHDAPTQRGPLLQRKGNTSQSKQAFCGEPAKFMQFASTDNVDLLAGLRQIEKMIQVNSRFLLNYNGFKGVARTPKPAGTR
jgi:hypothetical protein